MMEIIMDRNKWIKIQNHIFNSNDGMTWYNQGRLPRVLRNIGNASLVDLEFRHKEDAVMFLLRWS